MLECQKEPLHEVMKVKQHTFDQPGHVMNFKDQEPDLSETIPQNLLRAVQMYKELPFLSYRAGLATIPAELSDEYRSISYMQSLCYIHDISGQLRALGAQKGDRIAIYAKNSPLWLLTDFSAQFVQGVSVPLYDTLGIDNIKYCLNLVGAKYIFVSPEYVHNILGLIDHLPSLEHIILYEQITDPTITATLAAKVALHFSDGYEVIDDTRSLWSFASNNKIEISEPEVQLDIEPALSLMKSSKAQSGARTIELHEIALPADTGKEAVSVAQRELQAPEGQQCSDICSVIFTSGTSGFPKAALLTHTNVYSGGYCLGYRFVPYHLNLKGKQSSTLSYLPLAHVFEHALEHYVTMHGYNIYYSCGNIKNITQDFALAKPSMLIGVPRVYQKIYDTFTKTLAKQSIMVRAVFKLCYHLKDLYFALSPKAYATGRCKPFDAIAFHKISDIMGGNIEFIVSGSSALPKNVYDFLRICSCAKVTNGYALTEMSCSGLYNYIGQRYNSPNQLGYVCYESEGKIVQCDECEFDVERDRIGELCLRSPGIIVGYVDGEWGRVKDVRDAQGYYHTGDLCELHADGTCSFIRRISQVVKLSQGEFVDLCKIEDVIESSPLVITAFVHAEADKSAPVCVLSVDSKACEGKFGRLADAELKAALVKEIDRLVRKAGMKGFNVPKAAHIVKDADWTADRELFTPSQKKMARGFRARFAGELRGLFREFDNAGAKRGGYGAAALIVAAVCAIACAAIAMK